MFKLILIILLFVQTCTKKKEIEELRGVILLAVGDIRVDDKKVGNGAIVKIKNTIKVGEFSICDLQILGLESEVRIRLKPNSNFTFNESIVNNTKKFHPILNFGNALVKVNKLKKDESIEVFSPVTVAAVRGTGFEMNQTKELISISVFEGTISERKRMESFDLIPADILNKTSNLKLLKTFLDKETILEKTKTISYKNSEVTNLIKDSGLDKVLDSIVEELNSKKPVDEIINSAKLADSKLDGKRVENLISKIKTPNVEVIPETILIQSSKELDEIFFLDPTKLQDPSSIQSVIQKELAAKNESVLMIIERATGKRIETMKLKNGSSLKGIIFQGEDSYKIYTMEGMKEIKNDEVDEVSF